MNRLPFTVAFTLFAFNLISVARPVEANDDFDPDNLSILCENSPFNSRCADWEPFVTLEERPGEETSCQISPVDVNLSGLCKIDFTEDDIVAYVEYSKPGDKPVALGGKRGTLTVTIPSGQVFSRFTSRTAKLEHQGLVSKQVVEMGFLETPSDKEPNRTRFFRMVTSKENLLEQFYSLSVSDLRADILASSVQSVANISRLIETGECVHCNLSGSDLSGTDLATANLEGADLSNANLSGANLANAYLVGAVLDGANLTEADLSNSNLSLSSFSETTNLSRTKLSGAALVSVDLRDVRLKEAVLTPETTSNSSPLARIATVLAYSDLRNIDLSEASLEGVDFTGANLASSNLSGARLNSLSVRVTVPIFIGSETTEVSYAFDLPARFEKSNLQGANLSNANLNLANLEAADLSGADLTQSDFNRAYFVESDLSNALLQDTRLTTIDMSRASLFGTDLSSSDLEGSTFCNTTMPDGTLSNSDCR